jgi:hypothetical protein
LAIRVLFFSCTLPDDPLAALRVSQLDLHGSAIDLFAKFGHVPGHHDTALAGFESVASSPGDGWLSSPEGCISILKTS